MSRLDWLSQNWPKPEMEIIPVPPVVVTEIIEDKVPEIKVSIPDTKPVALMPNVRNPVLGYHDQRRFGRGAFQPPEYDLNEMGRIEDTDGYVRQAFEKKTALMFKEGWALEGKNPRTIKYVKTRLAQIAMASRMSTNTLFRNIGSNIVRKSNAFLLKTRKTEASGGRVRRLPNQTGEGVILKPVAAYFPIPAETMEFELTGTRISRWKQKMPNGEFKKMSPRNVVHIYHSRKDGFVFGTPSLIPVIDDVRALRKIEENIELLVYQHLFPLFQYKVGTEKSPAGFTEDGRREIDVVRTEIQFMPTEGGIVTPERHEITAIGSEGRALRAESYLDHFKNRVFSGLGVSAVDMGEGDTANRSTADNMSRNLVDAVKDLQQIVEDAVNMDIITELLLESTFGTDVLSEENVVRLKFKEIDVESKIKKEAHAGDLFNKDIIEHDEARKILGLEPWIVPTPDEVQVGNDGPESFPQWNKSRWKMYELPKLLIQALDEPYSPVAQASALDSSLPITEKGNEQASQKKNQQEVDLEKEKTKAKVAVAKATPKPSTKRDGFLQNIFAQTKKDVVQRVTQDQTIDHDWVASLIRTQLGTTINHLLSEQLIAFRQGYGSAGSVETQQFISSTSVARIQLRERAEHFVNKLTENVVSSLKRNVQADSEDITAKTRAVFESVEFRTRFIEDVEIRKAASLGRALATRDTNTTTSLASFTSRDDACTTCTSKSGIGFNLRFLSMDSLPPHHAGCHCTLDQSQQNVLVKDSVKDVTGEIAPPSPGTPLSKEPADTVPDDIATSDTVTDCPECGKTAIKQKDTESTFSCRACKNVFEFKNSTTEDDTDVEDKKPSLGSKRSQFRRCKSKFKAKMRSRNPDLDEEALESAAEQACFSFLIDDELEDDTLDSDDINTKDGTLGESDDK